MLKNMLQFISHSLLKFTSNVFKSLSQNTSKRVFNILGIFLLFVSIFSPSILTLAAQPAATPGVCIQSDITLASIFVPTNFIPIIEPQCSTTANGKARPLSFDVLPYVLLRAYGFLSALTVYLFGFIVLFSGLQYSYGALDGNSSVKALRNLKDAMIALFLIFSAFAVVNTLVIVLKVPGVVSNANLTSFFVPIR